MRRAMIVLLGIVLGLALAAPVEAGEPPFGNDGPPCHGNEQTTCRPDPQPSHGQDCEAHGANVDGNDDHCSLDPIEDMPGPDDGPPPCDSSPEVYAECEALATSPDGEVGTPATMDNPDPAVVLPPEQRPLSPVAYPDGAAQPPLLPDTAMPTPSGD